MKTRVIAGICMLPLLLIIYFGGPVLAVAAAIIGYVGITEFYNGWEALDVHPSKTIAYVMITLLYVFHFAVVYSGMGEKMTVILPWAVMLWFVIAVAAGMIYGWKITERGPYDAMATVLGLVYIPLFAYHLVLIDVFFSIFTWTVLIAAFGSDVFAYFTGYLIGKHKVAPNLSPKKTVEGCIGGIVGATALCALYGALFFKEHIFACVLIGILGGAVSQAGDLTASAFKRKMGIKDYGHLIPGHGGIMDRFDSVIFTAPFVFYLVLIHFALTGQI